jgi:hypothetical protein
VDVVEGVGRLVGGADARGRQPSPRRRYGVVVDRGLEVVDDILVLAVLRAVALLVEGGEAGGVLGVFVGPEVAVRGALADPISIAGFVVSVLGYFAEFQS